MILFKYDTYHIQMEQLTMGNAVVHFEIISKEGEKARKFYGSHFGWSFNTENPLNYGATDTEAGEESIRGGISDSFPGTKDTYVTFYISVTDVQKVLDELVEDGATVAMPVIELPGGSRMAQFIDPYGSRIGLLQG